MSIDQMRAKVKAVYDNDNWKNKVNAMGENQVVAIYYSFLRKGKFDPKPTVERDGQMTIFDYI